MREELTVIAGGFGGSMGGVAGSGKAKRPIGVKFEIPYFTTSGIQVRYLKIIEPKVSPCTLCGLPTTSTSERWWSCGKVDADAGSCSYNTPLCPGYDISHNRATLPCGYLMSKDDRSSRGRGGCMALRSSAERLRGRASMRCLCDTIAKAKAI